MPSYSVMPSNSLGDRSSVHDSDDSSEQNNGTLILAGAEIGLPRHREESEACLVLLHPPGPDIGKRTRLVNASYIVGRDASADLLTAAFGFRNLSSYERGFDEARRVLKPGGTLAILEFSQPPNRAFAALYGFYSERILPKIGAALSGAPDAYTYLPESVGKFPGAEALASMFTRAGFHDVRFERMTFGIVALHTGVREP